MQTEIIKCNNLGTDFNVTDQTGNISKVKCSSDEEPKPDALEYVNLFVIHFFYSKNPTNPFGNEHVVEEAGNSKTVCPSSEKGNLGKTGIYLDRNENLIKIQTRFNLEESCLTSTILLE